MEQAAYCYGWLPGRPNCHPVHTLKHIGMIEDLERAHATMLCWSMMGSGSISLPFLERQIYGDRKSVVFGNSVDDGGRRLI